MRVVTKWTFNQPRGAVWAKLCDSKMSDQRPCLFRFGVPKPVECRLPEGTCGVGGKRQCVSDKGLINQRITAWRENEHLAFEMEDTTIYFGPWVREMRDTFDLANVGGRTLVARTTDFSMNGSFAFVRGLLIWVGLKQVHRYVFRSWADS